MSFLGAGRMATAMVTGILHKNLYKPEEVACLGAPDGSAENLSSQTGIRHISRLEDLLIDCETIVLAFKPQQLSSMGPTHAELGANKLVISILAGSTLARLAEKFPKARNIIRAMPNTPGQIGAGITCYTAINELKRTDRETAENILGSMGLVLPLDENMLDAVTALSGSGPAYVFEFVAALRDAGIEAGLEAAVSARLSLETVLGAARLLARSGEKPETLRDWVSSPGGTTLAGLEVMEQENFRQIIVNTVQAAKNRSIELARD